MSSVDLDMPDPEPTEARPSEAPKRQRPVEIDVSVILRAIREGKTVYEVLAEKEPKHGN